MVFVFWKNVDYENFNIVLDLELNPESENLLIFDNNSIDELREKHEKNASKQVSVKSRSTYAALSYI